MGGLGVTRTLVSGSATFVEEPLAASCLLKCRSYIQGTNFYLLSLQQ